MINELHEIDNMEYMKDIPDKHFDLIIDDPPYGIGVNSMNMGKRKREIKKYHNKKWDKVPDKSYFTELLRISKNQIIWGIDYFKDIDGNGRIKWDKDISGNVPFSTYEMAFQSFDCEEYYIKIRIQNTKPFTRIHPTQKPIELYKWQLKNFAQPGWLLLDNHSGSGSFRIAAYDMGFDLVSCELDADYCRDNEARFQRHIQQQELFTPEEIQEKIYIDKELFNENCN